MKSGIGFIVFVVLFDIIQADTAVTVDCACDDSGSLKSEVDAAKKSVNYINALRNVLKNRYKDKLKIELANDPKDSQDKSTAQYDGQNSYKATKNEDESSEEKQSAHEVATPDYSVIDHYDGSDSDEEPHHEHKEEYNEQVGKKEEEDDDGGNYHYEEHYVQYGTGSGLPFSALPTPSSPQPPKKDDDKENDGNGNYHEVHNVQYQTQTVLSPASSPNSVPPQTQLSQPIEATACTCPNVAPGTFKAETQTTIQNDQTVKPNKLPQFSKFPQFPSPAQLSPLGFYPFPQPQLFASPSFPLRAPNPFQHFSRFQVPVPPGFGSAAKTFQRFSPVNMPLGYRLY